MIDHLVRFDSEDDARADATCGAYYVDGAWRGDCCIPGVVVWRPADNTQETVSGPDGDMVVTVRHPLPYWYLLIALPVMNDALRNHPTCMIAADRDAAALGDPAYVIYSPVPPDQLGDYFVEPTFAGSRYPSAGG